MTPGRCMCPPSAPRGKKLDPTLVRGTSINVQGSRRAVEVGPMRRLLPVLVLPALLAPAAQARVGPRLDGPVPVRRKPAQRVVAFAERQVGVRTPGAGSRAAPASTARASSTPRTA